MTHRRPPARIRRWLVAATTIVGTILVAAGPAAATWSIVAVDPETGEVGAAIASCVSADVLGDIDGPLAPVVLVPSVGAGVTQAQFDTTAPARIRTLLSEGLNADGVVAALIDPERDPLSAVRQHGVVVLDSGDGLPGAAGHDGSENGEVSVQLLGDGVAVQGNILVNEDVVNDALAAFDRSRSEGATLASALVGALAAGSAQGGDRRCEEQTALFAQVSTAAPGDDASQPEVLLTVIIDDDGEVNPVQELAVAWREGRRGLIDLTTDDGGTGPWFRIGVFAVAGLMVATAVVALRRGMGSISARR